MQRSRPLSSLAPGAFLSAILLASCAPAAPPDPRQALVGTWRSTVTQEDVLRVAPDFHREALCENTGTFTWNIKDNGTFTVDQTALPECPTPANPHVEDTWSVEGNRLTLAKDQPAQEVYEWVVDGEKLVLKHVSGGCIPCKATNTANPWTRMG